MFHMQSFFHKTLIETTMYLVSIYNLIINILPPVLKKIVLKIFLKKFSINCFIEQDIYIRNPFNLLIEKNCNINSGCKLYSSYNKFRDGRIEIRENVTLSPNVRIYAIGQDPHSKNFETISKPVIIKKNAWICADVTILPGVTIGENSVVAAKSIVNKSINDNEIWGGNPARYIKKRLNI